MAGVQHDIAGQVDQVPATKMTIEEYLGTNEGLKSDLMEGIGAGVAIHPTSNHREHQRVLLFLSVLLELYLAKHKLGEVLISGFPMYVGSSPSLRDTEFLFARPDIMIVLEAHTPRILPSYLEGIADVVVEIVSVESTVRDRGKKFVMYESLGVPEYWMIDPLRTDACIYTLHMNGLYRPVALNAKLCLPSVILPGFALDPGILWRESLPRGLEVISLVDAMDA